MEEEAHPPATIAWRSVRRRPVLHSSLVIIIVPSLSLLFIVFILLPSITPKIIPKPNSPLNTKPVSVKKSWDSLNIVLVVFAILCGVFARQNDDAPTAENQEERINGGGGAVLQNGGKSERQSGSSAPQWSGYAEQRIFSPTSTPVTGISRLRRTVSEMPPSQQQYEWDAGNDRRRFFDDFEINKFYQSNHHYQFFYPEMNRIEPENNRVEPNDHRSEPDADGGSVKEIPVDNFVLETRGELPSPSTTPPSAPSSAPHEPPPTPPPPPPMPNPRTFQAIRRRAAPHALPPENRSKPRRTFQSTHREESANHAPPPPPPPPPPPLPPPTPPLSQGGWGEKKKRSSRKRMNATKEIATAIASFYNHRKRKRKQKSKPHYEDRTSPPSMVDRTPPPAPAPPPPPPPLPPSVFHSLFRKGSKSKSNSKKVHSFSSSMPAPPPPPQRPPHSDRKPPLPTRAIIDLFDREESLPNSRNQSPLTPIPPPPPPPPPPMRQGGYDRVRWEVPEAESEELRSGEMDGGDEERERESVSVSVSSSTTVTACPSPDVNAKADTFIARHHHGWKLEKLNSWRDKHNVAAPPDPTQGPFFEERAHLSVFPN